MDFNARILDPMSPESGTPTRPSRPDGNLDHEESQLWRWALWFMIFLAFALAVLLWERLENIPFSLRAIPVGVLGLSILFAIYAYGRRQEVTELNDSLDDPACAVSLDGILRTVNRRVAELTGFSYSQLVGSKAFDLLEEPT